MRHGSRLLGVLFLLVCEASAAHAVPLLARRYGVSCSQCHVAPPKLNEFGEAFVGVGAEIDVVLGDAVAADLVEVIHGGVERDDIGAALP